ncbi:MAG: hypothetical protein HGA81_00990 [Chlorobium limicola]|jgi:hypothetical protein|uniref:Uncharacterized protein n=1 Tax=Chlorobium limicola (strain DSM 245 / NBRC 103803 / 6330) TaxID=290315 RepID=B3EEY2_CHLL2|nr:hypothetical protein [Chlorobium limicola]ACD89365.1 hypothetical protein Clim_0270 [Chlorobium limicola DSM 245]NTV07171.1 hypothetical protein [Chlorobium limicola]NTV20228.1 hypothetical protein [Chlorobium limicola]
MNPKEGPAMLKMIHERFCRQAQRLHEIIESFSLRILKKGLCSDIDEKTS